MRHGLGNGKYSHPAFLREVQTVAERIYPQIRHTVQTLCKSHRTKQEQTVMSAPSSFTIFSIMFSRKHLSRDDLFHLYDQLFLIQVWFSIYCSRTPHHSAGIKPQHHFQIIHAQVKLRNLTARYLAPDIRLPPRQASPRSEPSGGNRANRSNFFLFCRTNAT